MYKEMGHHTEWVEGFRDMGLVEATSGTSKREDVIQKSKTDGGMKEPFFSCEHFARNSAVGSRQVVSLASQTRFSRAVKIKIRPCSLSL